MKKLPIVVLLLAAAFVVRAADLSGTWSAANSGRYSPWVLWEWLWGVCWLDIAGTGFAKTWIERPLCFGRGDKALRRGFA